MLDIAERESARNTCDPHDGWPYRLVERGGYWPADRAAPVCMEGFTPQTMTPALFQFACEVRTDFGRWQRDEDWTLESGPDEAPSSLEIAVPYNYSGGSQDYFAGGCWNPGDPVEVETGTAWFFNEHSERCEVCLLQPGAERVETHIAENPLEPDYPEDWC